ncbi:MAG: hypothetical protein PVG97_02160 [Syntrophobacterales bacterium]|jgi:hypothetical protein
MYNIDDKDSLFRVSSYHLYRHGIQLCIDVQERISGKSKHQFYAAPHLDGRFTDEQKYWGVGDTEDTALQDCLERIKGVPKHLIFPSSAPPQPEK